MDIAAFFSTGGKSLRTATYQVDEAEILDKTFRFLVDHGLENVTIRELCKGTGYAVLLVRRQKRHYLRVYRIRLEKSYRRSFSVCFFEYGQSADAV